MKAGDSISPQLVGLRDVLDVHSGQYQDLAEAKDFGEYAVSKPSREDEELLTEPILTQLLERVLAFPADAYYPQYGRGGLKPDLTPMDLIAHRFVLDAKSSLQDLSKHEGQIRSYIDHRQLDFGVSSIFESCGHIEGARRGTIHSCPSPSRLCGPTPAANQWSHQSLRPSTGSSPSSHIVS